MHTAKYGVGEETYNTVGGIDGIRQLVKDFYQIMAENTDYQLIRNMHPNDLEVSVDKLACFLSGWMGGERLYQEKYGSINIPQVHSFLKIGENERDLWLSCMSEALEKQNYPKDLVTYLKGQFFIPAERIRQASEEHYE